MSEYIISKNEMPANSFVIARKLLRYRLLFSHYNTSFIANNFHENSAVTGDESNIPQLLSYVEIPAISICIPIKYDYRFHYDWRPQYLTDHSNIFYPELFILHANNFINLCFVILYFVIQYNWITSRLLRFVAQHFPKIHNQHFSFGHTESWSLSRSPP